MVKRVLLHELDAAQENTAAAGGACIFCNGLLVSVAETRKDRVVVLGLGDTHIVSFGLLSVRVSKRKGIVWRTAKGEALYIHLSHAYMRVLYRNFFCLVGIKVLPRLWLDLRHNLSIPLDPDSTIIKLEPGFISLIPVYSDYLKLRLLLGLHMCRCNSVSIE